MRWGRFGLFAVGLLVAEGRGKKGNHCKGHRQNKDFRGTFGFQD